MDRADIVIVGAGLAGLSLALFLRQFNHSFSLRIVDAGHRPDFSESPHGRSIALSHYSQQLLDRYGVWELLKTRAVPIKKIHISDRGHFGVTHISAEEMNVEALGYSVVLSHLAKTLQQQLANESIFLYEHEVSAYCPHTQTLSLKKGEKTHELQAKLIVAADGQNSTLRRLLNLRQEKIDYQQSAVVCNVTIDRPHHHIAYERFLKTGPIALLPIEHNQMALVWSDSPNQTALHQTLSDEAFLTALQEAFGDRAGVFTAASARSAYELPLLKTTQTTQPGLVLLGNAAHTLHPVAAQGFNLSLRDAHHLALAIHALPRSDDLSHIDWLKKYEAARKPDQQKTIAFTHHLLNIFSNDRFPFTPLRGWGLALLDNLPFLKKHIARRTMGYRI